MTQGQTLQTPKACPSCAGPGVLLGSSQLDDHKLGDSSSGGMQLWFRLAKEKYHYDTQSIHLCRQCGLIFIDPLLSDAEMIELLFAASGLSLDRHYHRRWSKPNLGAPSAIWSTAVRVPSYNDTLRPFVTRLLRVLDIGSHGGEISVNLDLPRGSQIDLLQLENSLLAVSPEAPHLENTRQFSGLLVDLIEAEPEYSADLVLALHVLEHVDNPRDVLRSCRQIVRRGGRFVLEVPYEPSVALDVALGRVFELPHHFFFTPWSLRHLLESSGFTIESLEVLTLAHTGVGLDPYSVLRAVCTGRDRNADPQESGIRNYYRSIDAVLGSFAGSIAFLGDIRFGVFIYREADRQLAQVFEECAGYSGLFTSNEQIDVPNVFQSLPEEIQYLITLTPQDRQALRQSVKANITIL